MNEAVFGFIGVIVGAIIPWAKELWSERSQRAKEARYLAVRVVCVLEKFADECVKVVGDDGYTIDGSHAGLTKGGEPYCKSTTETPSAPEFPADIDWKSIDPELMFRALILPSSQRRTDEDITAASEFSEYPDNSSYFYARRIGYAKLGLEALSISDRFRRQFKMPKNELGEFKPEDFFREQISTLEMKKIPNGLSVDAV